MADEGFLPPVVATFMANYADMVAGTERVIGSLQGVQDTAVRASEGASVAMDSLGVASERADGQMSLFGAGADRVAEQLSLFAVKADATAVQVDTAATSMTASMDRLSISAAGDAAKWDVEMATMSASMDKMAANVDAAALSAFERGTVREETLTVQSVSVTSPGYTTCTVTFTSNLAFTHAANTAVSEKMSTSDYNNNITDVAYYDPASILGSTTTLAY